MGEGRGRGEDQQPSPAGLRRESRDLLIGQLSQTVRSTHHSNNTLIHTHARGQAGANDNVIASVVGVRQTVRHVGRPIMLHSGYRAWGACVGVAPAGLHKQLKQIPYARS